MLKEVTIFAEDTLLYEGDYKAGGEGEWAEEGAKKIEGGLALFRELSEQVDKFYSPEYQKVREDTRNEFPKDSCWDVPIENTGRVFGGDIKYTGTLAEAADFGIEIFSGDLPNVRKFKLIKSLVEIELSNSKLRMVEEISQGRKWADDLNKVTMPSIRCTTAPQEYILQEGVRQESTENMKKGLVHGGMHLSKIPSLRVIELNKFNSGDNSSNLGLLPKIMEKISLRNKKIQK